MGTIKRSAAGGRTANTAAPSPSVTPGGNGGIYSNNGNADVKINVGGGVTGGRSKKTTFSTYNAYSAYKSMDRGAGRNAPASGDGMPASSVATGVGPVRTKQYAKLDEVVVDDGGGGYNGGGGYPINNGQKNVRQDFGQHARMNSNTSGGNGSIERDRNGSGPRYPPNYPPNANVAVSYTQNTGQQQNTRQNGGGPRPYPGGSGPRSGSVGRM
ncbi:hypothetical protein HDU82_005864 [Entophlyctis luteolus]|nr:hypothetical protein HDU82_005864 [Entophlyctis luteolus]